MQNDFHKYCVPGRICLIGDKIDLMGMPVIAAAVDTLMTLKFRKTCNRQIKIYTDTFQSGLEYTLGEKGDWNHYLKYWCAIIYRLKDKIGGFEASVSSNIPVGAGLSSSAAISVILLRALNQEFQLNMHDGQIAEIAYLVEHDDLGIMCGRMDQNAIAYGGITFIETGETPSVINLPVKTLPVVVGDSLEERQAKKVLNSVKDRLNQKDPCVHGAFKKIHACVLDAKHALLHGDYEKLGKLMNIQQDQENIIGTTTPKLNKMCDAAIAAGAYGAKQMGAGGGGCMIAVCPGNQEQVAKAITQAGGKAWIFNIYDYN